MQVYMESRWKLQRHVQYIEGCRNVELLTSISSPLCNSFSLILWTRRVCDSLRKYILFPTCYHRIKRTGAGMCRVPKFTQACCLASCFKTSSSAMMRQASRGSMASEHFGTTPNMRCQAISAVHICPIKPHYTTGQHVLISIEMFLLKILMTAPLEQRTASLLSASLLQSFPAFLHLP